MAEKAVTKVSKGPNLVPQWPVRINKWGDIHVKKDMLASASHFSQINKGQELKMVFEKGKIVITPA